MKSLVIGALVLIMSTLPVDAPSVHTSDGSPIVVRAKWWIPGITQVPAFKFELDGRSLIAGRDFTTHNNGAYVTATVPISYGHSGRLMTVVENGIDTVTRYTVINP